MSITTNRRSFLFGASVAGFGIFAQGRRGWAGGVGPNETLNIACIGVGGKGESDTDQAADHGRIVALCDIDQKRLDADGREAQGSQEVQRLSASCSHELDSQDRRRGRLDARPHPRPGRRDGHAAGQARLLPEAAGPLGLGSPADARDGPPEEGLHPDGQPGDGRPGLPPRRRAGPRRAPSARCSEVHVWTNRPFKYWKQAPDIVARPKETIPVPTHVHWDLFLGPAPERPYNPVYHPHDWRGWWDFGTGSLGDMACHTANLAFMALQLGLPVRVSAKSGEINSETYPAWATITYEFPARGNLPPVKLTWYEGAKDGKRNLPPARLFPDRGFKPSDSGSLLIGSKWRMYSPNDYGAVQMLWPEASTRTSRTPSASLPRIEGARRPTTTRSASGSRPSAPASRRCALSNFDYASTLTESMLLGNVAVRSGQAIDYNPETGEITGSSSASQYLKPYFRKGWEI